MFVQEEKIFAGKVLRLHICASDGAEWLEEATEDTSVEKLKERCLKHCAPGSSEDPKSVSHHKLIHAASERVLSDARTILEESVQDEDVLLLIRKRAPSPLPKMAEVSAEEKKKQEQKAPDRDAIFRATANLPSRDMDRAAVQTSPRDFQTELRKILVSLIEVAQKLLALNPDAVELFKKANAMLDEDEDERVDEAALRQLTEMGFPESRAVKALRLNHMSVPQAMEWLIEHGDEEARDELTEIFKKIRRKREFRADARAVVSLMEMGFDEKEVMDALRVNNNQQNAACEWLLGDRKPSPEELDQGIDPESPLFQAILDNPVVQLGLTNPKTLLGVCLLSAGSGGPGSHRTDGPADTAVTTPGSSCHECRVGPGDWALLAVGQPPMRWLCSSFDKPVKVDDPGRQCRQQRRVGPSLRACWLTGSYSCEAFPWHFFRL
uniref:Calmodulin regulated spectrin associated protein 1 n=1 Tax=Sus scrofa TaxID=9823 RepID=A0A8D1PL04_PIG